MAEWTRVVKTTIEKHLKDEEVNILQNQKFTALLQMKNRIVYNQSGKSFTWRVKKKRNALQQYGDGGGINFDRVNRHEVAELPWRGYALGESITVKEKKMNRGKEAIIDFVSDLGESMVDDAKYHFCREMYLDGNAAGRQDSIHGFQSWTGVTGSAQYTQPSDTYAGLSTVLGNYGGSVIEGTWPIGKFDPEYYFWSPLIVNYSHADWAAGTDNWANNCLQALRSGMIHQRNQKGKEGQLDLILTTASMYDQFLDQLDEKERIQVKRDGEKSGLVSLGFTDVVNYDGCDISYEVDIPDTMGFGINIDSMLLRCLTSQLFEMDKDKDVQTLSDQMVAYFFGNLQANPRHFVLWDDITGA